MINISFIFNRARNLIVSPKTEWAVIKSESQNQKVVIRKYALPLILLMALCSIVGSMIMVSNVWYAVLKALGIFGFAYAGIYISSLIINELTSSFNSKKNLDTTFQLVVYSCTAYFLVMAIVLLLPPLGLLSAFGLYAAYLFWEGSVILLGTPEDNRVGFVVVSALVMAGVYAILYLILEGILNSVLSIKFLT